MATRGVKTFSRQLMNTDEGGSSLSRNLSRFLHFQGIHFSTISNPASSRASFDSAPWVSSGLNAESVGRNGERGVDAATGREKRSVDHIQVLETVGAVKPVDDVGGWVVAHAGGSAGVGQQFRVVGVL